jgi:hypothetical protein
MSRPLPPSNAAPVSRDVVEIVRKKTAPTSPPPNSFRQFQGPKSLDSYSPARGNTSRESKESDDKSKDSEDSEDESESKFVYVPKVIKRQAKDDPDSDETDSDREDEPQIAMPKTLSKENSQNQYDDKSSRNSESQSPPRRRNSEAKEGKQGALYLPPKRNSLRVSTSNKDMSKESSVKNSFSNDTSNASLIAANVNVLDFVAELATKPYSIFNFPAFLKSAKNRKLKSFLLSPIDPGYLVKCYIERDRSGTNMFAPMYTLCADLEDGTGLVD